MMIEISGKSYRLVAFLDVDSDPTDDYASAHYALVQRPKDVRPEGQKQTYLKLPIRNARKQ